MLISAGVLALMGITTAETQYPSHLHYSTFANTISDLGSLQTPAAGIFNDTMIVAGLAVIVGALCTHQRKLITIPLLAFALGVLGVGIFPEEHHHLHAGFSLAAFVFGALTAILLAVTERGPFRYVALVLGVVSSFFLVAGGSLLGRALGEGGVERWVVYPVILWLVAYGMHLLGPRASYCERSRFSDVEGRAVTLGTPETP